MILVYLCMVDNVGLHKIIVRIFAQTISNDQKASLSNPTISTLKY